jgi:hypothetical protein
VGGQLGRLGPIQVGGSSSRPNPVVGGDREPGRWGPRGTKKCFGFRVDA